MMAEFSMFGPEGSAVKFAQTYNQREELHPLKMREAQAAEALSRAHTRLYDVQAREKEQELAGNAEVAAEMARLAQEPQAPRESSAAAPFEMLSNAYMRKGLLTKAASTAEKASQIRSHETAAEASKALQLKRQFDMGAQKMELAGGVAAMAQDQASFDEAIRAYPLLLQSRGLPPEEHPLKGATWSPDLIRNFNQTMLSTKERAELALRAEQEKARAKAAESREKLDNARRGLISKRIERINQQISDTKKSGGAATPLDPLKEEKRKATEALRQIREQKLIGKRPDLPKLLTPADKDPAKRVVGDYYRGAGGRVAQWTGQGWKAVAPGTAAAPARSVAPPPPEDDDDEED